jgi:general secretion pathway protein F
MAKFTAKVRDARGLVKEIEFEAASESAAMDEARRRGSLLSLKKQRGLSFRTPLSSADRLIFLTRLSAMLASRMGAGESLALIRDTFTGPVSNVAGRLHAYVEAGDDIAGAVAKVGEPDFPENVAAVIMAGSRTGETWKALRDAKDFEQEILKARKGSMRGMWQAVGGFLFAGITVIATDHWAGPMITESGLLQMAPAGSVDIDWVLLVGKISAWIIGVVLVGMFLLFLLAMVGKRVAPKQADKLILRIPYYKDLVMARNNFITFYGLSLLVGSGVRLEESLRLASGVAPAGALRQNLLDAMAAVRNGLPWAKQLTMLHPTDRAALMSSQDREQTAKAFDALAVQYKDLYSYRLGTLVPSLTMVAALFLSIAGFVLFGATILPMLQVAKGMM